MTTIFDWWSGSFSGVTPEEEKPFFFMRTRSSRSSFSSVSAVSSCWTMVFSSTDSLVGIAGLRYGLPMAVVVTAVVAAAGVASGSLMYLTFLSLAFEPLF